MADKFTKEKRSNIMSHIAGKETKPEVMVRKFLFTKGLRYRKNDKRLPGKTDIVLPKYRTAVFVHGCFWHGHTGCPKSKLPDTQKEFWKKKISGNIKRDKKDIDELKLKKWNVITIWQCEISNTVKRRERLESLVHEIRVNGSRIRIGP